MNDKTVVLNAELVNYDGKIDYSTIASDVTIYDFTPEDKILERVQGHDIVVTKEMKVSKEVIKQFPDSVKMIIEAGTGYNNIDLEAVREKGIILTNIPAYSTQRVAQTGAMLMLALASTLQKQIRMLAENNKDNFQKHLMVDHVELNDKTLGVIGFGNTGKELIRIAKSMDMNILVSTRTPRQDRDGIKFTTLEEVLKNSDFISLNCPLNESTHHLINKETLAMMKPSAYLINTARGPIINQDELVEALKNNVIAGAGLDVQEVEPLPLDSPLYDMDNVIITPHIGWRGLETRQRLIDLVGKNVEAFKQGQPINRVDNL